MGSNRKNVVVIVSEKGRQTYDRYVEIMKEIWDDPVLNKLKQLPPEAVAIFSEVLDVMSGSCSSHSKEEPELTPLEVPADKNAPERE